MTYMGRYEAWAERSTRLRMVALAFVGAVGAISLVGCAAAEAEVVVSSSPVVAQAEPTAEPADVEAAKACSAASVLFGMDARNASRLQAGEIDQAQYDSRSALVVEAWALVVADTSAVSVELDATSAAAAAVPFDRAAFESTLQPLQSACDSAGYTVAYQMLPGMGG